ncbi:MAG: FapA family protein, partial [Chitinispirillaceae bacterium]|nr:FapA family protein [Chitinispirillaceae bacterium]
MAKHNIPSENDDLERELARLEKLLDKGLDEISNIEIEEYTRGFSEEELKEKLESLNVQRSEYSSARKYGNFVFMDTIQFFIDKKSKNASEIDLEELDLIKDVEGGELIAICQLEEKDTLLYDKILKEYNDVYQGQAGIVLKSDGMKISLYASRKGKVVVLADKIFVVPIDRDAKCIVYVSQDKMEAKVDLIPARGNGVPLRISTVLDELEKKGVIRGVNRKAIEEAVELVNKENIVCKELIVAKGQLPRNGRDAQLTFHFPTDTPEIGFKILPDGRIDYKKQAPIKMVKAGDLLVTVGNAEKGEDGFLVTGEILKAEAGSDDVILEGENVRRGEDGKSFYAECNGMVSFHDKILSVFPHYCVNGDVDMKSGNINFNGSVTVLGTVRMGFEVKAAGDIFVSGSVEAAILEAGRDIRVNGAIVGGEDSYVKAGRNIFAGHVQNANLEAQGDITVVRSIMHSYVYSTGKVSLHDRDGAIVGGVVNAMKGINAMSIGSEMGTPTEVVVGSDYLVKRKKEEFYKIAEFYEANLKKIDT